MLNKFLTVLAIVYLITAIEASWWTIAGLLGAFAAVYIIGLGDGAQIPPLDVEDDDK
jgi:hypothetical protein